MHLIWRNWAPLSMCSAQECVCGRIKFVVFMWRNQQEGQHPTPKVARKGHTWLLVQLIRTPGKLQGNSSPPLYGELLKTTHHKRISSRTIEKSQVLILPLHFLTHHTTVFQDSGVPAKLSSSFGPSFSKSVTPWKLKPYNLGGWHPRLGIDVIDRQFLNWHGSVYSYF